MFCGKIFGICLKIKNFALSHQHVIKINYFINNLIFGEDTPEFYESLPKRALVIVAEP